ncbi:MAG: hypothetical protein V3V92_03440 [Candidatus Hydrothermarchaeales archaeon]
MKVLTSKIIQLQKKELEEMLDNNIEVLSCQCKGDYPTELKKWVKEEMETCQRDGNLMRLDELKRGKISGPDMETVKTLLKKKKLFQIELVVRDKDFGILESGYDGDYTYIVNYGRKK